MSGTILCFLGIEVPLIHPIRNRQLGSDQVKKLRPDTCMRKGKDAIVLKLHMLMALRATSFTERGSTR
jgi:hypothetical protein